MGKTGTMHAWEQEGIRGPDIQTIGKALGAGFVPLSGVLLHQEIFEALSAGSGGLAHGHTFQVFFRISSDLFAKAEPAYRPTPLLVLRRSRLKISLSETI
jgi:glutamate-1-semialdehyde aminotransferase